MILGVDPRHNGGLAWVDAITGDLIGVVDMPTLAGVVNAPILENLIASYGPIEMIVVETQQAYPKQGVSSSFKTGVGFGIIIGVTACSGNPVHFWHSSAWKKILHLSKDKELSRKKAIERWPHDIENFKLKKYEGRAEAALMAESWRLSTERVRTVQAPAKRLKRLAKRTPVATVP